MVSLRVNPSVLVSVTEHACLAYNVDSNQLHRLNPTAALLLELCDAARTREIVLDAMKPVMDEAGLAGCSAWLDEALAQGLLVDCDPSTPPTPFTAAQLSQLANDLRYTDRVLAAYICQSRAAELEQENPLQWYALGELAHIVGHRAEARAAYEQYHRAHPDDVEVEHLLIALRDDPPPTRASNTYIEQLYSRFAAFYNENVCGDLEYRAPELLAGAIASAIANPNGLSVLDLGCGTGLFGQLIRSSARLLTGIDLSQSMIERAKDRRIYDRLETAEITAWLGRDPSDRYDVIAICDTLIYFGDLRQVIPLATRHLTAGGILAFTVEQGDTYPFRLTDSGRFDHHRDHIEEVAAESSLGIITLAEETLRYEYGRPVIGSVVVLAPH